MATARAPMINARFKSFFMVITMPFLCCFTGLISVYEMMQKTYRIRKKSKKFSEMRS
jgi:hypothetical protein